MDQNETDDGMPEPSRGKTPKTPKVEYQLWTEWDLVAEIMPPLGKGTESVRCAALWLTRLLQERYSYEAGDNYFSFFTATGQLTIHWNSDSKTPGEFFFSVSKKKEDSPPVPYERISVALIRKGEPAFVSQRMIKNPIDPRLHSLVLTEDDLRKAGEMDHCAIWVLVETNS